MPTLYPMSRAHAFTPPEFHNPITGPNELCYPPSSNDPAYNYGTSDYPHAFDGSHNAYGSYAKPQGLPMRNSGALKHAPSMPTAINGFASALEHRQKLSSHAPAPILPPIRMPDTMLDANHYAGPSTTARAMNQSRAAAAAAAMEKAADKPVSGGVAATLDYEIEHMVDFVVEAAQGMYDLFASRLCLADVDLAASVQPGSSAAAAAAIAPEFRKYVSSVLTSTRLPSSTVVLALYYLTKRLEFLSEARRGSNSSNGSIGTGNGMLTSTVSISGRTSIIDLTARGHTGTHSQLYPLLTTALMLASKFLDDNTFQNRSWADVSQIPVKELNSTELAWLSDIDWKLHFDPRDHTKDFSMWFDRWRLYQKRREDADAQAEAANTPGTVAAQSVERLKLNTAAAVTSNAMEICPPAQNRVQHQQPQFVQQPTAMRAPQAFMPPPTPAYTPYGHHEPTYLPPWSHTDRNSVSSSVWAPNAPAQWPSRIRDTPPSATNWTNWPPASATSATALRREVGSATSPNKAWPDWSSAISVAARKLTPPSANNSGPATPDYYGRGGRNASIHGATGGNGVFGSAYAAPQPLFATYANKASQQHGQPQQHPAHHAPNVAIASTNHSPFDAPYPSFHAAAWGPGGTHNMGHGMGCGCGYCMHAERYLAGHSYGMQTVVG